MVKDGGEWRWAVEGYGWEGLSVGSEAVSIRALVERGNHRMTGWKAIISWCGANRLEGVRTDPSCKAI